MPSRMAERHWRQTRDGFLLWAALILTKAGLCALSDKYKLVADAGSTGTRVYLFDQSGGELVVHDIGKGRPLTDFEAAPGKAAEAVMAQLEEAWKQNRIPENMRGEVPVSIFATAGMRLLKQDAQDSIHKGVKDGLASAGFNKDLARLESRTISGREEGVFALIAANYGAGHLDGSLKATTGGLMGVLDLGGSSTQVAIPPPISPGEHLTPKLGVKDTYVRSYLNLGMERMRQRTYQSFVRTASGTARSMRAVANPCSFYGYSEADDAWRGTGHASECEKAIIKVLEEENATCSAAAGTECLSSAPLPLPGGAGDAPRLFLISGYLYVTDFAAWVLKQPDLRPHGALDPAVLAKPTIDDLRQAADVLCSVPWDRLSGVANDQQRQHPFTKAKKVPHRCFELNYIVALLSFGYGLPEKERLFHIVEEVGGREIEWTLGAFLHGLSGKDGEDAEL